MFLGFCIFHLPVILFFRISLGFLTRVKRSMSPWNDQGWYDGDFVGVRVLRLLIKTLFETAMIRFIAHYNLIPVFVTLIEFQAPSSGRKIRQKVCFSHLLVQPCSDYVWLFKTMAPFSVLMETVILVFFRCWSSEIFNNIC